MSIELSIIERYSEETEAVNLSCGGNLDFAAVQPGDIIIDLGCGRGAETMLAARKAVEGKAIGLDITPKMVQAAREQAALKGLTNVDFVEGELDSLPFPENYADVVISNCAINHVSAKEKVFGEIFRVLRPGGRFVVSDIMAQELLPVEISTDPEEIAACFGGAIPSDEYFTAIRNAGFLEVEILKERNYLKKGYGLISRTLRAFKK